MTATFRMWSVGAMLARLSPDIPGKSSVPLRIRKEWTRRTLIRKHEDHPMSQLLSDRYLAGLAMCKKDWVDAIDILCDANPSKRIRVNEAAETRSGGQVIRVNKLKLIKLYFYESNSSSRNTKIEMKRTCWFYARKTHRSSTYAEIFR